MHNPDRSLKPFIKDFGKNFMNQMSHCASKNVYHDYEGWSKYVLLPTPVTSHCLGRKGNEIISIVEHLAVLWNFSKDIYKLNDTIFYELAKTPMKKLNVNVLKRLPNWCVYIDLNVNFAIANDDYEEVVDGFYVFLDDMSCSERENALYLYIVIVKEGEKFKPIGFPLIDGTVLEALEVGHQRNLSSGLNVDDMSEEEIDYTLRSAANLAGIFLPIVFYICSEGADIRYRGSSAVKHNLLIDRKKKKRIFSPSKSRVWEVGKVLEKQKEAFERLKGKHGKRVEPHIRRAHWHGFWKNGDDGDKELVYRWIPPIYVNSDVAHANVQTNR